MHICIFIASLTGGGAERVACLLANAFSEASDVARVTVVTGDGALEPGYTLSPGVNRVSLDLNGPSPSMWAGMKAALRRISALREVVLRLKPDVAFAFMDEMSVLVSIACRGTGIPVIASLRSNPRGPNLKPVWRRLRVPFLILGCDAVVVQSSAALALSARLFPGAKLHVIPNPLAEMPTPTPMNSRARRIVAAGRLVKGKCFDHLISAFSRSRAASEGWELCIYGRGPEEAALNEQIDAMGLVGRARLMGATDSIFERFGEAAISVLASRTEGFPNVLLEAAAMGCACISTDCEFGPQDILRSGAGILVPTDNIPALTKALDRLAADDELREVLSRKGVRLRDTYRIEEIVVAWTDLFRGCVTDRRS